jgi:hypothetical protein
MENISDYGTQAAEEEELEQQEEQEQQEQPEAEELREGAVAAQLLAVVPADAHVSSVWIPAQMITRAQLQQLLDSTDWAPEEERVYLVELEGSFTLDDLLHIMHTTNWTDDIDENWVDDGRYDDGGVGTLSIPLQRGSGVSGVGKKGEKGAKKRGRKVRLRASFILQSNNHLLIPNSLFLTLSLTRAQGGRRLRPEHHLQGPRRIRWRRSRRSCCRGVSAGGRNK